MGDGDIPFDNKDDLVVQYDFLLLYYRKIILIFLSLHSSAGGMTQKGTFTQNGDEIQISNILGMTTIVKIVKDGLIDDDGILWSRK